MNADARRPAYYLGIDLGGTNVKSGVVDDAGRPVSSVSVETKAGQGPEAGVRTLAEAGRLAVESAALKWDEITAVGLGSPGTMNIHTGMLLNPPNLPGWDNFPIRDRLAAMLRKPVAFQNDANAAAYGEYWAGAGRGAQSLVMFTLGTGIGCGIVDHGRIVEGRHSHGAECGHLIIQMEGGREHPPGYFGRLEAYASATALVKRAEEALDAGEESTLRKVRDEGKLNARTIDRAGDEGDAPGQAAHGRDGPIPRRGGHEPDAHDRPGHRPVRGRDDRGRDRVPRRHPRRDSTDRLPPSPPHRRESSTPSWGETPGSSARPGAPGWRSVCRLRWRCRFECGERFHAEIGRNAEFRREEMARSWNSLRNPASLPVSAGCAF